MNIQSLGTFLAPTYQFVKEGYNKTAAFACSFFKNLASSLVPSTKTRIYTALILTTAFSMCMPLAAAHETWTEKDMKLTNICCSPGFFLQVINIIYKFLNQDKLPQNTQYFTSGRAFPFWAASNGTCNLNIYENVEVYTGLLSIQPSINNPDEFFTATFNPPRTKVLLLTDCPLNPTALSNECQKNGIFLIIQKITIPK